MAEANVLVVGASGVGKSTLINAVIGQDQALTGSGMQGVTQQVTVYEQPSLSFRLIDTAGFEPALVRRLQAIRKIQKWTLADKQNHRIHVIWFCVDGTSRKLFQRDLHNFTQAISLWTHVPVIVVITKSYSEADELENLKMVREALTKDRKTKINLRQIIPVVAKTYPLNATTFVPPKGIDHLVETTNTLLPEGSRAAQKDIERYLRNRRRVFAHSIVTTAATSGALVAAIPLPLADAAVLGPIEVAMLSTLARLYGLSKFKDFKQLRNTIIEVGAVGTAAKTTLSMLKAIPGINLAAEVLNVLVAAGFISAIGEASIYIFEQIALGKRSPEDIDWIEKVVNGAFSDSFFKTLTKAAHNATQLKDIRKIANMVADLFTKSKSKD